MWGIRAWRTGEKEEGEGENGVRERRGGKNGERGSVKEGDGMKERGRKRKRERHLTTMATMTDNSFSTKKKKRIEKVLLN